MRRLMLLLGAGFVVLGLWVSCFVIVYMARSSTSFEKYGLFGDSFGAVNALFSGLALIGVVVTVYLQSKDLKESVTAQKKSAEAHRELVGLEKQLVQAQGEAAEAQRDSATAQKEWVEGQGEVVAAQIAAAKALNASMLQQKALCEIGIIQSKISTLSSLISAKRNIIDMLPQHFTGGGPHFSIDGKDVDGSRIKAYIQGEIVSANNDLQSLKQKLDKMQVG